METRKFGFGTGTVSLITLLVALFLTMLAALSLSGTSVQNGFTNEMTQRNEHYAQADRQAQQMLSLIDNTLLTGKELPAICEKEGNEVAFSIPVSESLYLQVRLQINAGSEAARYTITEYRILPNEEWTPETEGGNLWQGKGDV